jgi:thioesterase domain-containing protein
LAAYQIAADLTQAGRKVDLLCLLDPIPGLPGKIEEQISIEHRDQKSLWDRIGKREDETIYLAFERIAFRALMASGQFELARRLVHASRKKYDFKRGHWRRRDLLDVFRGRAMRAWAPSPCKVRTLLFTSELSRSFGFAEYWSNLCDDLTVEPVVADHWGIFDPEPLVHLAPALLRALGLGAPFATATALESA